MSILGLKERFAEETCNEFLDWLEEGRQVLLLRFRMAYDQELVLKDKWHMEIVEAREPLTAGQFETLMFKRLCIVTLIRQRIEHALNLIDFGGDYGAFNPQFRRKLLHVWIRTTKH